MSGYNAETPEPPRKSHEIVDEIDALEPLGGNPSDEAVEQLEAAKDAAKQLIESGAVGRTGPDGAYFAAAIHVWANPGHECVIGDPTDRITVEVRQVDYEPPAPPPEPEAEQAEAGAETEQELEPAVS